MSARVASLGLLPLRPVDLRTAQRDGRVAAYAPCRALPEPAALNPNQGGSKRAGCVNAAQCLFSLSLQRELSPVPGILDGLSQTGPVRAFERSSFDVSHLHTCTIE